MGREYIVLPIKDIVKNIDALTNNKNTFIIFATINSYPKGIPNLVLDIKDVDRDEFGYLEDRHIVGLFKNLDDIRYSDRVIVGCDAGISRSPGIATGLAIYLKDYEEYDKLKHRYRFANIDMAIDIVKGLTKLEYSM
jgi:predicted protein tyrosine phosphatase